MLVSTLSLHSSDVEENEAAAGNMPRTKLRELQRLDLLVPKRAYAIQHSLDILWIGVLHTEGLVCSLPRRGKEQACAFHKFFCFLLSSPLLSITLLKYKIVVFHLRCSV